MDCIQRVKNIEALQALPFHQKLGLGVFYLEDTEILNFDNFKQVDELYIYETHKKNINLQYLEDYTDVKFLINCGHTKNIDSIGRLKDLEVLYLNSVSKVPLNFINRLSKLKTLKIILGGRENINEILENEIEHLEIIWVRGFCDLSNLHRFNNLKVLQVKDQKQLKEITFPYLPKVEDVKILNCKSLERVNGLDNLPQLKGLRFYQTNVAYKELMNQPLPATLKVFAFYTTKSKQDKIIREDLDERGYVEFE